MAGLRINRDDQHELAIEDLIAVSTRVPGLHILPTAEWMVQIEYFGETWLARVHAWDAVAEADAARLVTEAGRGSDQILVANQISAAATDLLRERSDGWSWYDRRNGLELRHRIKGEHGDPDRDVHIVWQSGGEHAPGHGRTNPPNPKLAAPPSNGPIRGRAGLALAATLLRDGGQDSLRMLAPQVNLSHTALNTAARQLREAGLVRPDGTPELPDLFEELAKVWQPQRIAPVDRLPDPATIDRIGANLFDLEQRGWALGGDEAALAWGAPMFAMTKPWFWVPGHTDARRAERELGEATWNDYAAVVAVAPTPVVCDRRRYPPTPSSEWPTADPVFLALELAQDPGRGREILGQWMLEEVRRVL